MVGVGAGVQLKLVHRGALQRPTHSKSSSTKETRDANNANQIGKHCADGAGQRAAQLDDDDVAQRTAATHRLDALRLRRALRSTAIDAQRFPLTSSGKRSLLVAHAASLPPATDGLSTETMKSEFSAIDKPGKRAAAARGDQPRASIEALCAPTSGAPRCIEPSAVDRRCATSDDAREDRDRSSRRSAAALRPICRSDGERRCLARDQAKTDFGTSGTSTSVGVND